MAMTVRKVNQLPKGLIIEVMCDHGGYSFTVNDGKPTWYKYDGDNGYVGLNPTRDKKLIDKLYKEWRDVRFYG